jgi:hypothetical protein
MNTTTKAPRDRAMLAIQIVIWAFLIGAAVISFSHIVEASHMLGLGDESYLSPFFIDGIAIVGKISMMPKFTEPFRKSGFKLLMFGGVLSLACNVGAGANWGERAFGVLVVAGFMVLENHATKAGKQAVAPQVDPAEAARQQVIVEAAAQQAAEEAAEAARRSESAKKAAQTRRENAAREAKEKADKLEARRQRAALRKLEEAMPTSSGQPAVVLSANDKAVLAEYMTKS